MPTPRLSRHRSRPRWRVCTAVPPTVLNAHAANARSILTLVLAAFGLVNVIDSLSVPWSSLVITLLLALLALGFRVVALHACGKRFPWLLSASVAIGLAIADFYTLLTTAPAAGAGAGALVIFVAILLLVIRHRTRQRPPPLPRRTSEAPSGATRGLPEQHIEQALRKAPNPTEPARSAADIRES